MLEVNGISYRYQNESWLFKQLNITIEPGEVVGLFGPSGSGKSTMAKIIAGYIKPQEGFVKADGEHYFHNKVNPVQLVWQHPEKAINPRWRMKETIIEGEQLDEGLLHTLGIRNEWLTRFPSELSGGELQRFCLARALGPSTRYLIADEMTTMLDALTQAQIWHAVLRLTKERNVGMLAISHDRHLLSRISGRIIDFSDLVHNSSETV
ncbi:ABC transporter ATP-binding protein [Virgibacillus necropolis]|uniref:ABC transporter ATP-binding protein n=1 Tax=Virgibacillus necropolis TaxID=163877 RepID=A0A221MH16_9BACI|nr:ATP-binding cassette domain-containing protein [Virgibacillus necropolis]ASN06946.1 ABC transporter ATP-binding protein [Virgibacillus necropolis]